MQVSPLRALVAVAEITSTPARFAVLFSTENEPLRPLVTRVPDQTFSPLSVIATDQRWPFRLASTSNSTSRRPSSALAFSFAWVEAVQVPATRTAEAPPWRAWASGGAQGDGGDGEGCAGDECSGESGDVHEDSFWIFGPAVPVPHHKAAGAVVQPAIGRWS